jgi:predicted  nucleic acid-binding Zn-ribbon protein
MASKLEDEQSLVAKLQKQIKELQGRIRRIEQTETRLRKQLEKERTRIALDGQQIGR